METGAVHVRFILEALVPRILAPHAGKAEMGQTEEKLHTWRCGYDSGPLCSTWLLDFGKSARSYGGLKRIGASCKGQDTD